MAIGVGHPDSTALAIVIVRGNMPQRIDDTGEPIVGVDSKTGDAPKRIRPIGPVAHGVRLVTRGIEAGIDDPAESAAGIVFVLGDVTKPIRKGRHISVTVISPG